MSRIGQTIAQYEILERIGAGGMGEVFKARDSRLQRVVALKLLPAQVQTDREARERFFQEARAAASLTHPCICTIYDAGEEDGQGYIAMELIEGETLKDFLSGTPVDDPSKSAERMMSVGLQIARGLDKAHRMGIVHRDVKPANVMLSSDGEAKILDFGLAKLAGGLQLTHVGSTVGTAAYMSPEQARGEEVDARSDLWSLGAVLYEMLSGVKPFKGDYDSAIIYSILNEDPRPIEEINPDLPDDVIKLVSDLLKKKPSDRPESAADVVGVLSRHASSLSLAAAPAVTASASRSVPLKLLVAIGLPVAAILAAALFLLAGPSSEDEDVLPPVSDEVVAVMPFSVRGSPELDYLGEGMVSLLSTKLDGAGDLQTVDPRAILSLVDREHSGDVIDPEVAAGIARRFGAGRFILGDIIELGGRVELSASLFNLGTLSEAAGSGSVEGDAGDLFSLLDRLASQLLVTGTAGRSSRARELATLTTNSLPALKSYLEGETAFREGDFQRAVAAFARATELDSTFALAYYRLSIAFEWGPGTPADVHGAAQKALRYANRLSDRDRQLLDAFATWRDGETEAAEDKYYAYLSVYPDDVEALFQLGEVLFHTRTLRGLTRKAAREPFERVLRLEPSNTHAMQHLVRIAALEQKRDEVERHIRAVREFSPDSRLPVNALMDLAGMSRDVPDDSVFAALAGLDDGSRANAIGELIYYARDPNRAFRFFAAGGGPDLFWPAAAVGSGRLASADSLFAARERADPVGILEARGMQALLPLIGDDANTASSLADALISLRPDQRPLGVEGDVPTAAEEIGRLELIGRLLARAGRIAEARTYAQQLGEKLPIPLSGSFFNDGVQIIEAEVALAEGRVEDALAALERTRLNMHYLYVNVWPGGLREEVRLMRADLLRRLGRQRESVQWYQSVVEDGLLLVGPAYWGLASVLDELGQTDEAILNYRLFIKHWERADPELQELRQDAIRRLDELLKSTAREPKS